MSDFTFNVKTIIKKLKEILKCDICHCLFDFKDHIPLITKTGETFCKQCLSDDQINLKVENKLKVNIHNENLFINRFIENLKIKLIIKEILNLYDNKISEKFIVFPKHSNEGNNSNNLRSGHYLLTYNNSSKILEEKISMNVYNKNDSKKNFYINNINNEINKIINLNNNINYKNEKIINNKNNGKDKKENHYKINSQEIGIKNILNNNLINKNLNTNNLNISDMDENMNTLPLNDEININLDKERNLFEEKENNDIRKISDDSIETIPINEEKSTANISFKKEFNDFFLKRDESQDESNNQNKIKNDLNKYVFVNKNNFIYKNNQKIKSSNANMKMRSQMNSKEKRIVEPNNMFYNLSEPNFENINSCKKNEILNTNKKKKINNKIIKKENSINTKIEENEIKRIYKNSKYYDLKNKQKIEGMDNYESNNKINISNNKYKKHNKIIINKHQPITPRQIISQEVKKKIEGEAEENIRYKNLTSIKDNNNINNYENNKNILFDEDEIRITAIHNINNDIEYKEKLFFSNNINKKSKCFINNPKIKHNITYNKKILGKSSLSPIKNNSQDFSANKNNNEEYFKKIRSYKNYNLKFRTISHVQANENLINTDNNISTNVIMRSCTTKNNIPVSMINNSYKNINNTNNINSIPKITSIYLKINNSKKNIINKKNNSSKNNPNINIFNISNNNISNLDKINQIEDEIKYIPDEKIISDRKAKTFMYKTKDELDNAYSGNKLNINKKKSNNQNISINNYLENKNKEFNILYNERLKKEQNPNIQNHLLKNKSKYLKILKNSVNCPLLKNSLDEVQILFLQNGDFYLGLLSSQYNSPLKGILYSTEDNYYEGMFLNGKKEGKGTIIYKNGAKYEGEIKNNLHNGFGKLTQLDGEIFVGQWKDGKINGKGVRYHKNGDVYSGDYMNSIRDGIGKYVFSNGDSYEGQWKNGKANGKGIFKFKNGDIYEGYFRDNNFCGQGCFRKKKGDIYIGEFKNGELDGEGTFINKDKEKYIGKFIEGKKDGNGVLYDKNGIIIKSGIWRSDQFISE